jgi:hypothetical protein
MESSSERFTQAVCLPFLLYEVVEWFHGSEVPF